jgi:CxxC-x17-CxxC domain-containing protein
VQQQDKRLTCAECGTEFIFTAGEQAFYAEKGFTNEPRRCPTCRQSRRADRGGGGGGGGGGYRGSGGSYTGGGSYGTTRTMYPITCAQCGKQADVPFQPRGDRPVYCSDCYSTQGSRSTGPRF